MFAAFLERLDGGNVWLDQFVSTAAGITRVARLDLTTTLQGRQVSGVYRVPGSNTMYLLAERAGRMLAGYQVMPGVTIVEFRVSSAAQPPIVTWSVELPDCFAPMRATAGINAAMGYVAQQAALYFGCGNGKPPEFIEPPVRRGVAKLGLKADPRSGSTGAPTPADFVLFGHDGDFKTSDSFFDPQSSRMLYSTISGGNTTVYAFDAKSETYVGGISVGGNKIKQPGFDPTIGRFYGGSPGEVGMVMADAAPTPLAQGVSVPEFAGPPANPIAEGPMGIDALTHRLFLKYDGVDKFTIAQDRLPPYVVPPEPSDPPTVDVEESPGLTRSTFSPSAQGFGVRVRQIGGIASLAINYTGRDTRQYGVEGGTREFRGAYLNSLKLANTEASASAISLDRDQASTQGDLEKTKPDANSQPLADWPIAEASCFDFGGQAKDNVERDDSRVSCDADAHRAQATAVSRPFTASGVTIESGSVDASARLDAARGALASVKAAARGISVLGGVLQVGNVETVAEAASKGRPGTATSEFVATVRNVVLNGASLCADNCNPIVVARQVNDVLAGRVRIEFPQPDSASRSTPSGYQALVRRSAAEQLQQVLLNEQPTERIEVPGMVITVYEDAARPSRTVYEFAAVEAEARYGISLLGGDPDDQDIDLPVLSGPLFGLGPIETPYLGGPGAGSGSLGGSAGVTGVGARNGIAEAGRLIWNGLTDAGRLLPVWAVLLAPIYLSTRRWLLLQRSSLTSGGAR